MAREACICPSPLRIPAHVLSVSSSFKSRMSLPVCHGVFILAFSCNYTVSLKADCRTQSQAVLACTCCRCEENPHKLILRDYLTSRDALCAGTASASRQNRSSLGNRTHLQDRRPRLRGEVAYAEREDGPDFRNGLCEAETECRISLWAASLRRGGEACPGM